MKRGYLTQEANKIKDQPVIKKWLKDTKPSTQKVYLVSMALFCTITNKTPEELLEIAWQEADERVPPWKQSIEKWFEDLDIYLEEKTNFKNTANTRRNAVVNFFHTFKIPTPEIKGRRGKKKFTGTNERPPLTKEDLKLILNAAKTFKLKSLILTQASSGLTEVDTLNLTVKQFYDGLIQLDDNKEICQIYNEREKTTRKHYTFIGYESVDLIKKYLTLERKEPIEGPLFTSSKTGNKQYGVIGYSSAVIRLNELLGWTTEKGKYNLFTSHMLRKFFQTQLTNSGCISEHVTHMMGWRLPGMRAHYYLAHPDELQKSYVEHLNYLTLENVETVTIDSPDVKEIKENQKRELAARDKKIAEMEKDLKEVMAMARKYMKAGKETQ